jgi:hypothetical protein
VGDRPGGSWRGGIPPSPPGLRVQPHPSAYAALGRVRRARPGCGRAGSAGTPPTAWVPTWGVRRAGRSRRTSRPAAPVATTEHEYRTPPRLRPFASAALGVIRSTSSGIPGLAAGSHSVPDHISTWHSYGPPSGPAWSRSPPPLRTFRERIPSGTGRMLPCGRCCGTLAGAFDVRKGTTYRRWEGAEGCQDPRREGAPIARGSASPGRTRCGSHNPRQGSPPSGPGTRTARWEAIRDGIRQSFCGRQRG